MFQRIEAGVRRNSHAGQSVDRSQRPRVLHDDEEVDTEASQVG